MFELRGERGEAVGWGTGMGLNTGVHVLSGERIGLELF
jgi:hypothetical protein